MCRDVYTFAELEFFGIRTEEQRNAFIEDCKAKYGDCFVRVFSDSIVIEYDYWSRKAPENVGYLTPCIRTHSGRLIPWTLKETAKYMVKATNE